MRSDFEKYLLSLQKQMDDMNKAVEEANKLITAGEMDQEHAANINKYMEVITSNYQRLIYARYLLDIPPKFIQWFRKKKLDREMKKFQEQQADQESVEKEGQEALDNIGEIIKEAGGQQDEQS